MGRGVREHLFGLPGAPSAASSSSDDDDDEYEEDDDAWYIQKHTMSYSVSTSLLYPYVHVFVQEAEYSTRTLRGTAKNHSPPPAAHRRHETPSSPSTHLATQRWGAPLAGAGTRRTCRAFPRRRAPRILRCLGCAQAQAV